MAGRAKQRRAHGARVRLGLAALVLATATAALAPPIPVAAAISSAPRFTGPLPADGTASSGVTLRLFGSPASGSPQPAHQWQERVGDSPTWTDVAGSNSTMLVTVQRPSSDLVVRYRLVATNSVGSAVSGEVTYHWGPGPSVALEPLDATVDTGGTVELRSELVVVDPALGTSTPLVERWERSTDGIDWTSIPDATGDVLSLGPVTYALDRTLYRATASNTYGTARSRAALLRVVPSAPVATAPADVELIWGGTATFTSVASGDPAPTVRWQRSATATGPWTDVVGATQATYTHPATRADDGSWFRAVWTSPGGVHETSPAQLRVAEPSFAAPTIAASVSPPPNAAGWVNAPATVSFSCTSERLASCTEPATLTSEVRDATVVGTVVDVHGRTATTSARLGIDRTAPTITARAITPATTAWTYTGPVTVRWTCADAFSGVLWCPADRVVSGLGTHTVTGTVVDLAGNASSASVTFDIVEPTGTIGGRVLDGTGRPIAGAQLRFTNPSTYQLAAQVWTGADGSYRTPSIPSGSYLVDVIAYGFVVRTIGGVIVPRTTALDVRLTAAPSTAGIKGRITSSTTGKAIGSVTVEAYLLGASRRVATTTTGADGRYQLPRLPAGKYQLRFVRTGYASGWYSTSAAPVTSQGTATAVTARTSCTGSLNSTWGDPCAQVANETLRPS